MKLRTLFSATISLCVLCCAQAVQAQFVANTFSLPTSGGNILIQPPGSVSGTTTLTLPGTSGTLLAAPTDAQGLLKVGVNVTQTLPPADGSTYLFDVRIR